jgi:hypothetical protein
VVLLASHYSPSLLEPMQVPRMLLGRQGEVTKRVAPLVKAFVRGTQPSLLDFGELMSSAEAPRALFPLNPGRSGGPSADFHCYAFLWGVLAAETKGKVNRERCEEAFGWSLEQPWSFLGTLSQVGTFFFVKVDRAGFVKEPPPEVLRVLTRGRPEWYLPFLMATLRHWGVLAAEGQRYTPAPLGLPREFTSVAHPIISVLGHMGLVKSPADVDTSEKVLRAVQRAVAHPPN